MTTVSRKPLYPVLCMTFSNTQPHPTRSTLYIERQHLDNDILLQVIEEYFRDYSAQEIQQLTNTICDDPHSRERGLRSVRINHSTDSYTLFIMV